MKTPARRFFLPAVVAVFGLTIALLARAQDNPPPPPTPAAAPATPAAEPEKGAPAAPADVPAAEVPAAKATPAPAPDPAKSELRRLDVDTPKTEAAAETPAVEKAANEDSDAPAATKSDAPAKRERHGRPGRNRGNERVTFGGDSTLAAGETAQAVVSIFGSSTSAGTVHDAVVSVLGSSTSSGEVGNAVVSVLGSSRVTGGKVGDSVVSVLGTTYVNAPVRGQVVAVLGDVELGPDAVVDGELVCVGGIVKRDAQAVVHGQVNNIGLGVSFGSFQWLHAWVKNCLLWGRPLAFGAHLMWAWWIALAALALYVIVALLFPSGVEKCVQTLETRPGYSLLSALLVTLLTPLAVILLLITIVGTPALVIFLFLAGIFGKVTMLAWLGRRIAKATRQDILATPALAVLMGGVIVLFLYTIPFVGFALAKLISWLGLGVVVYTIILGMKRNKPAPVVRAAAATGATTMGGIPAVPGPVPGTTGDATSAMGFAAPASGSEGVPPVAPLQSAGFGAASDAGSPPVTPVSAVPQMTPPPVIVAASTLARAGFWIRLAASAIDVAVVAVARGLLPDRWEPNLMLTVAVYCCVLWALKGTTIGGIICNLKVVRVDDRPIDWPTSLVRTLGGFVSLVVCGLGFIWVAFDDQKQSWHDKIAGTTVVVVPKGVSLV